MSGRDDEISAARRRAERRELRRLHREAVVTLADSLNMPARAYAIPRRHKRRARPSAAILDSQNGD